MRSPRDPHGMGSGYATVSNSSRVVGLPEWRLPGLSSLPGQVSSPVSSGAAITGTVMSSVTASAFRTEATNLTVTITGSTISATVNGGQFTLQGVPPGNIELHFSGPGVDARLTITDVGDRDDIHITVRVTGNTAELEDHRHDKPDHQSELEGTLAAVDATSRDLAVTSGSQTIELHVAVGVPITRDGAARGFESLEPSMRVVLSFKHAGEARRLSRIAILR